MQFMEKVKTFLKKSWNVWLWGALLCIGLVAVDLVTKIVADHLWDPGDPSVKIIPGYLELCLTYNRGMSFSIGYNAPAGAKIAVIALTAVLFVAFGAYYVMIDKRRTWVRMSLVFIVAGGVGNLIDRVYYRVWDPSSFGGVRDMVRLKIFMFDFGVCNFADFFIVGGAIALMVAMLFFDAGALYPLTEKYKALSKEYEEKEEKKQEEKREKAKAFAMRKAEAGKASLETVEISTVAEEATGTVEGVETPAVVTETAQAEENSTTEEEKKD